MRRLLALSALVLSACDGATTATAPADVAPVQVTRLEDRIVIAFDCPAASPSCADATIRAAETKELAGDRGRSVLVNVGAADGAANYQLQGVASDPATAGPVLARYRWNGGGEAGAASVARWCIANDADAPLCKALRADPAVCNPLAEAETAKLCAA